VRAGWPVFSPAYSTRGMRPQYALLHARWTDDSPSRHNRELEATLTKSESLPAYCVTRLWFLQNPEANGEL